jgi:cation:H+ antiporter
MKEYILLVIGIFLLLKSADYIIKGSTSLARKLGISTFVIGITIVAFGTSLPELIINVLAALRGNSQINFGVIIGSNLSNTLLILGLMALICDLKVKNNTTWKEIPFLLFSVLLLFVFFLVSKLFNIGDFYLNRLHGLIFLSFFILFIYYISKIIKKDKLLYKEIKLELKNESYLYITLMIILGIIGIFLGSKLTIDNGIIIATTLNISEFLISATVFAIGTSLPELVVSIMAAFKKNVDLAVGNIVGSNIFNIIFVLGLTLLIKPLKFPEFLLFDLSILLLSTFLLFLFMFTGQKHKLDKWEGAIFILIYISYIIFIVIRG